jgi:putative addiction module killer protein
LLILTKVREAIFFETTDGKHPAQEWLENLKDLKGRAKIYTRIRRAEQGNFGEYKDLKGGLYEIKEAFGPGYRMYFTLSPIDELIILFLGGDKRTQDRDIFKAKELLHEYKKQIQG